MNTHSYFLGGLVVASLFATKVADADSVSDFRTGTVLYLRSGKSYTVDTEQTTGGLTIGKPANTLAFSVPAAQFGLAFPLSLTFTPSATTPSTITYTVGEQATGPVDVSGNGDMLTSVTGTVTVTLEQVPGNQPTVGNVAIHVPLSTLVAHGTWGSTAISVEGELIGGSLPSRLKYFSSDADGVTVCSGAYPSDVSLTFTLEHPAPSAGQIINISSSDPLVQVPQSIHVQPGVTLSGASAEIPANYVGTSRLVASANGAVAYLDLQIHAKSDCPKHSGPPVAVNWNLECPQCNAFQSLTDRGETLATADRSPKIFTAKQLVDLLATFSSSGATAISATNLSLTGFITGMVTIRGVAHPYLANYRTEPNVLHLLDTMTPAFVNAHGVAVGSQVDTRSGQLRAVYNTGTGVKLLPLPFSAQSSRATLVTDSGEIIGTFTPVGGGTQGFRSRPSATVALPTVGTSSAIAVAANASGQIAANGTDSFGHPVAAIIDANNRPLLLGSPVGYTGFALRSINNAGWAVGIATSATGAGQRAFVWIPNQGFTALSGYTRSLTLADDALQIDNNNNVVVHGTNAGATNLFILSL